LLLLFALLALPIPFRGTPPIGWAVAPAWCSRVRFVARGTPGRAANPEFAAGLNPRAALSSSSFCVASLLSVTRLIVPRCRGAECKSLSNLGACEFVHNSTGAGIEHTPRCNLGDFGAGSRLPEGLAPSF